MHSRRLLVHALAGLLGMGWASGALAAGAKPAAKTDLEVDTARAVEVSSVPAPVFDERRLLNYFFVNVRVDIKEGENILRARERVHFLRDSLVRGFHRRSVASVDAYTELDREAALAVVRAAAEETYGADAIARVDVTFAESLRRPPASVGR